MQFAGGSLPPRGKLSGLSQCRKFTDNIRMNASAEQRKNLPMANFIFAIGKLLKPACKRNPPCGDLQEKNACAQTAAAKPQQQACCKHSGYAILHKNEEPQLVWNCGFCIIFWR